MVFWRRTDCRLPSRSVAQLFAHPGAMRTTGTFRPHRVKLFDHVPCVALACQVFQIAADELIQARVPRRRDASSFRDDLIVDGQRDFHEAHIARVRTARQRPTAAPNGTRCRGSRFRVMLWTRARGRFVRNTWRRARTDASGSGGRHMNDKTRNAQAVGNERRIVREPANAARVEQRPLSGLESASTPICSRPTPA